MSEPDELPRAALVVSWWRRVPRAVAGTTWRRLYLLVAGLLALEIVGFRWLSGWAS